MTYIRFFVKHVTFLKKFQTLEDFQIKLCMGKFVSVVDHYIFKCWKWICNSPKIETVKSNGNVNITFLSAVHLTINLI